MAKNKVWGGQLEMNALANALKFNVIVHRVDGPSMANVFHEPVEDYPVLHLSYHLGSHYNSVRRGDDKLILNEAPICNYPIGYDLKKIKKMLKGKLDQQKSPKVIEKKSKKTIINKSTRKI